MNVESTESGKTMMLLYVGPDQLLPLTSILGAIGGAIMIFWRQLVGVSKKVVKVFRRSA